MNNIIKFKYFINKILIRITVDKKKLKKYFNCERSVEKSVRDALNFINWGSK